VINAPPPIIHLPLSNNFTISHQNYQPLLHTTHVYNQQLCHDLYTGVHIYRKTGNSCAWHQSSTLLACPKGLSRTVFSHHFTVERAYKKNLSPVADHGKKTHVAILKISTIFKRESLKHSKSVGHKWLPLGHTPTPTSCVYPLFVPFVVGNTRPFRLCAAHLKK
jgi:hypothetical protein